MKKFILIFFIFLVSCKNDVISYPPNTIEVFYRKSGRLYPMSFGCGWVNNPEITKGESNYLKIYDKAYVEKFLKLYNELEIDTTVKNVDVRVHILVHQGIKYDTLCLGDHFGTVKNGQFMKDSKELFNLIKQRINENGI